MCIFYIVITVTCWFSKEEGFATFTKWIVEVGNISELIVVRVIVVQVAIRNIYL